MPEPVKQLGIVILPSTTGVLSWTVPIVDGTGSPANFVNDAVGNNLLYWPVLAVYPQGCNAAVSNATVLLNRISLDSTPVTLATGVYVLTLTVTGSGLTAGTYDIRYNTSGNNFIGANPAIDQRNLPFAAFGVGNLPEVNTVQIGGWIQAGGIDVPTAVDLLASLVVWLGSPPEPALTCQAVDANGNVQAFANAAQIATAVWSYLCTTANTLGLTTLGGWLLSTLNNVFGRVSATPIQALALVQPGGAIELQQYCSYRAERGNALAISVNVPFDLTGADVHLWIAQQSNGTPIMPPKIDVPSCTVVGPLTAATGLSADISSADTGALTSLSANAYAWCFVAYYAANGDQVPITDWSDCTVTPGAALTS